jgi:hypothetical protein
VCFSEKYASSSKEEEEEELLELVKFSPANNPISTADDVDAARPWLRFR